MALMTGDTLAQVELRTDSGLPRDNIVNTFALAQTPGETPTYADAAARLSTFYTALRLLLSNTLAPSGHEVKFYELTDPQPRLPVAIEPIGIAGATGAIGFPAEVAICASLRAVGYGQSGVPQGQRRGRIFLGPIAQTVGSIGTDGYLRVDTGNRGTIATACQDLDSGLAADGWQWCVWSRTANSLYRVTGGWVEDEFDTQRRRGPGPLTRTAWSGLI